VSISEQKPPKQTRNGFRLLVFDWDGTLIDSIASIVDCTLATVRELGLAEPTDRGIRDAIGLGLQETVERLAPGCGEEVFQQIIAGYRRHWLATYGQRAELISGARATLEGLTADGYQLAVATAKSRSGLRRDTERLGVTDLFCTTRTVTEAPSKPHPKMILDIVNQLGVDPDETLMIGDTTHDLEMARNAGVAALGVCTGSQPRGRLERATPLGCLDSVADLPAWLKTRRGGIEPSRQEEPPCGAD
jgi:phosphoglycolate phosphatase